MRQVGGIIILQRNDGNILVEFYVSSIILQCHFCLAAPAASTKEGQN